MKRQLASGAVVDIESTKDTGRIARTNSGILCKVVGKIKGMSARESFAFVLEFPLNSGRLVTQSRNVFHYQD